MQRGPTAHIQWIYPTKAQHHRGDLRRLPLRSLYATRRARENRACRAATALAQDPAWVSRCCAGPVRRVYTSPSCPRGSRAWKARILC
jgi:hypothetical protein